MSPDEAICSYATLDGHRVICDHPDLPRAKYPSLGTCKRCPENTTQGRWPKNLVKVTIEKSTIGKAVTFLQAQATAKRVSLEIANERYEICSKCQHKKIKDGIEICGMGCGCPTKPRFGVIKSLTEVEENLPKWGCKHPLRRRGKGWLR